MPTDSLSASMETIEADFSASVLTGDGVIIGMIEPGVPYATDSALDGKVTTLSANTNEDNDTHATNVAKIIHAMASDATIVAVASSSSAATYVGIE